VNPVSRFTLVVKDTAKINYHPENGMACDSTAVGTTSKQIISHGQTQVF